MAVSDSENLYRLLGVQSTATQAEIQSAYKQKARELHPDVNKAPDAEEQFKKLVAAYAILKDEQKRSRYDKYGFADGKVRDRPPPPPPRRETRRRGNTQGFSSRDFGFGDVRFEDINLDGDDPRSPFDVFLRREQRRQRKEREVQLAISLEHAYKGTTLNMVMDLPTDEGFTETKRVRLKIPQGAKEGDRLKLKDPDVTVVLKFEENSKYEVNGRDITTTLDLAPWEAALGGTVDTTTPGGIVKVKVPPGTSSGQKLRLRGQGLPVKPGRDGEPGDLYAVVKIVVPKQLSDRERELMEELAKISEFVPRE